MYIAYTKITHAHKVFILTWKSVNGPHRYLFVGAIHKRVATFYEKGCTERYLPLLEDTFQVQRARLLAHVPNVELIHFVVYGKERPCCRGAALYRVARMGSVWRESRTVAQRRVWECSPNHSNLLRYLMYEIAAVVARTRVSSRFTRSRLFIPSPPLGEGWEENRESSFSLAMRLNCHTRLCKHRLLITSRERGTKKKPSKFFCLFWMSHVFKLQISPAREVSRLLN